MHEPSTWATLACSLPVSTSDHKDALSTEDRRWRIACCDHLSSTVCSHNPPNAMAAQTKAILLSTLLATASCTTLQQRDRQDSVASPDPIKNEIGPFTFDFPNVKERKKAEKLALQGDPELARRLGRYYGIVERNRAEARRWEMIAVLNGSIAEQLDMASFLCTFNNEDAWSYSKALLENAARKGSKDAVERLKWHEKDLKDWRKSYESDLQQLRQLGYHGSLPSHSATNF